MTARRPFLPKDLLDRVLIADVAVSPDGATVAFVRQTVVDGKERSRIWAVPFSGGTPEPLTSADASATSPAFSPDGGWLGYLSERGSVKGEETAQPWRLSLRGGEPDALPTLPEGADTFAWAPSGDAVLCTGSSNEPRFPVGDRKDPTARVISHPHWLNDGQGIRDPLTSAWLVPMEGEAKRLTDPLAMVHQAFWSPDGERVGFLADLGEPKPDDQPSIWSVGRTGGEPEHLVTFDGRVELAAWGAKKIAFAGLTASFLAYRNLGLFVADEDGVRQLAPGRDLFFIGYAWSDVLPLLDLGPTWIDDDRFIASTCTNGRGIPFFVGADEEPRALFPLDTRDEIGQIATGGGRVAVIASVDGAAGEIHELDPTDGSLRQVTTEAATWFGPFARSPEEIVVKHPDGHEVQGWLVRATGAETERRPVVFHIHGGPYDLTKNAPMAECLMLADAGFHVAAMNPRGSVGFGEAFTEALHGRWGQPDAEDLLATIDHLAGEGLIDPDRVGILGLSYGGFMVNHLLGAYPGRFRAAVSENPFTEAIADLGAGDSGMTMEDETGVGHLEDDFEGWLALSPALRIHRNEAPLLLLQAEDDVRCPPVHSQIVFSILHRLGRTVELVRYPGEHHIMALDGRPDRRVDRLERILDWFTRYLA